MANLRKCINCETDSQLDDYRAIWTASKHDMESGYVGDVIKQSKVTSL
jgi:hypothetical protein